MTIAPTSSVSPDPAIYMVPTSFAQQRLWFLDQLEPQSAAYNIPASLRLNIALNVGALEQSFNALVQRHEVLRTTFVAVDGQPMQVIVPALALPLPLVDLSTLSNAEREAEALRLASEQAQHPFDLAQGPLMRVLLLQLAAEEYALLLTIHHIISDGWSIGVLFQELAALYTAFASGQPLPLPDLPVQYADFVLWQQERVQGDLLADDLAYWKQQLAGAPARLDLPTDRPPAAVPTSRGSAHLLTLSPALTEALKALSRREDVTLHMMLVAAFQTLLYRYSGQDDMVLGTVTAGRGQAELETLIGFFVNTLVLRTDLSGNPTFRELLGRVREVTLEAYAHQEVPFDYLVKELHPTRSSGQNPLFQVMLVLQPPPPTLPSRWERSQMVVEMGTARFDLSLDLADQPEGLVCRFEYSSDLFDAATIAHMAGHWQTFLEDIVADPARHLAELSLLSEAERQQVLVQWNHTQKEYPQQLCLHQLFEAQVQRTPEAVALVYEDQQLTYSELNRRANQLAHHLVSLGVGPGVRVGICLERSLELAIGLLGILKAGGVYVPLDPDYPPERLTFMLADAQARALITQQSLLNLFPSQATRLIRIDVDREQIDRRAQENLNSGVSPDSPVYIIYTSGSTGTPKGVVVTHCNVARLFAATDEWYHFSERDVWTLFHSYAFDFSVWELWGALLYGGRVVVVPYLLSRSPDEFYQLLVREHVTVLNQTPSAFYQLIGLEQAAEVDGELSLRLVIFGGEALEPRKLKPWFDRHGDQQPQLVNMYGITETTVHVTYRPLTAVDLSSSSGSAIGSPIPDLQVYVLDQHHQLVPAGVPGELYVGGAGVALGYFNRPELTAQRFVPNPFSPNPGARLYKTGDLARYLPNGELKYLGRIDQQVKIRGFRIELGEIEAVLGKHPAVRETVVIARKDGGGDRRLVAYVVAEPGEEASAAKLRRYLQQYLPDYMLPALFVPLDALPLTPNGKVDRRALPAPDMARLEQTDDYVAPRTPTEEILASIWAKVLHRERVGIHENFFDLGGHSLLATQIITRLRNTFQIELSLSTIFRSPTIAELTAVIEAMLMDEIEELNEEEMQRQTAK